MVNPRIQQKTDCTYIVLRCLIDADETFPRNSRHVWVNPFTPVAPKNALTIFAISLWLDSKVIFKSIIDPDNICPGDFQPRVLKSTH